MKLYNQVCDPLQAQKIKELGVSQESIFYTDRLANLYMGRGVDKLRLSDWTIHNGTTVGDFFSSYTAAELGVMLGIDKSLYSYNDLIKKWYYQGYTHRDNLYNTYGVDIEQYTKNEAYRRAADLIVGLSIKRLTPEEVNTRLNNQ